MPQLRQPFAAYWGGRHHVHRQMARISRQVARGQSGGAGESEIRAKSRVCSFYTHISDQYAPFHTKVINAAVRDATHVLDGSVVPRIGFAD
jgi:TnpA family transposase